MSIVAGVDFGMLSVRVSLFDKNRGRLGSGATEYPLNRSVRDANLATQSRAAQMNALENAMRKALEASNVNGDEIKVSQACPSGAESTASTARKASRITASVSSMCSIMASRDRWGSRWLMIS
jgi:ribulose kinase